MPHVERIVAAHHQLRGADDIDQMTQSLRLVDERVEPDSSQVVARSRYGACMRLRPNLVTMIGAAAVARQIAAAVRGHDLQARMAIEHAAKDEMRQRNRRLERLSDDVAEVVRAQPLAQRRAERMNEDDSAKLSSRRPERRELRGAQLALVDSRGNLHAFQALVLHGLTQLHGGEFRMLKRDRSQADESVGMLCAELRDVFVLNAHDAPCEILIGPVVVLRRRGLSTCMSTFMASMSARRSSSRVSFGTPSAASPSRCAPSTPRQPRLASGQPQPASADGPRPAAPQPGSARDSESPP